MNADCLGARIIYVAERRKAGIDTLPRFLAQSSRGVCGELSDIFVCHSKLNRHHQHIVVRIVRAVVRLDVANDALLQKPLHLSAVHWIACEAVYLPTNNAVCFTLLYPRHHVAEHGTARRFCAFLFDKFLNDLQVIALRKRAQFQKLRFNRQNLFVFNVCRFSCV
ncbi:MAG: hypothetical protein QF858_03040 [Candidatus Pacebacteria bacterium]|nr:hypothetical protein [Candidatus Paceibacterota bacterium]